MPTGLYNQVPFLTSPEFKKSDHSQHLWIYQFWFWYRNLCYFWNIQVGRWWKHTALVLFFWTFDFLLFQIIFNQKEPLNFWFSIISDNFESKGTFFKKGTFGKVWYIADQFDPIPSHHGFSEGTKKETMSSKKWKWRKRLWKGSVEL